MKTLYILANLIIIILPAQAKPFSNICIAAAAREDIINPQAKITGHNNTPHISSRVESRSKMIYSAMSVKQDEHSSAVKSEEIAGYEKEIFKSFYDGNCCSLFDNIESFLFKFPDSPEAISYCYDLVRLTGVYGFGRVEKTLKRLLSIVEKLKGFDKRNLYSLILKLELEKLLYNYKRSDAESLSAQLFPLKKWTILGPYKYYGAFDLDYPFIPEITTQLNNSNLKKKIISIKSPLGFLDLRKYLYPEDGIAYAITTIKHTGPVKIRVYSASSYKLFINGKEVIKNVKGKTFRRCRIVRIWETPSTTIMVKIMKSEKWRFRVLVTDDNDAVLNNSYDPDNMNYSNFQYLEQMDYPFDLFIEKSSINPAESYFRLGGYYSELESQEAIEFYKKSLLEDKNPIKRYFLAYSLIDAGNENRNSSFYMEGWKMLTDLANKYPDFVPAQHKRFQKLVERRSILQAYFEGKALLEKAEYYLPFRLDYAGLLSSLGYEKELEEEIRSFLKAFPSSYTPLLISLNYYKDKNLYKSIELCKKILNRNYSGNALANLVRIYRSQGNYQEAISLIKKYDFEGNFKKDIIELLIKTGNFPAAKRVIIEEMIKKDDPYYNLKLGFISFIKDNDPSMYWKKALSISPSLFSLEDLLDYIRNNKLENPFSKLLKNRFNDYIFSWGLKDFNKGESAILYRGMIFQLNSDGSSRAFFEDIIYINDEKGLMKWGEYAIPFKGKFHPVRIRVYNSDGSVSDSYTSRKINGRRYVNLSSLKKGAMVHLSYYLDNSITGPHGSKFFNIPFKTICEFNETLLNFSLMVIAPQEMEINFCFHKELNISSESVDDKVIYSVELNNLQTIEPESYMGNRLNYLPYFAFSTMKDIKDFVLWYNGILSGTFNLDSDFLKDQFKGNTVIDITNKVYNYVARDIDSRGNILFFPDMARNTIYNRSGTVENKVILAKAILDSLGIRSYMAMAKGNDLPNFGSFVSPDIFLNILLYIPLEDNTGLWMDFSSQFYMCGVVNENIAGTNAIVIIRDNYEIKKIDESCNDKICANFTININNKGDASYDIGIDFHGRKGRLRDYFKNKIYNEDIINHYFGRIIPSISIDEYGIDNLDNYNNPFKIWIKGESFALAAAGMKKLIFQPVLNRSKVYNYIRYPERKHPLVIESPIDEREKYTYYLPSEFNSYKIDENYDIKSIFGYAKINIQKTKDSNVLDIVKEIKIRKSKIKPSQYRDFLDFCLRLKDVEFQNIVIRR